MIASRKRIALLGECLIELNGQPFGEVTQSYGGDTLNTALYLARLTAAQADIRYATALGTDVFSAALLQRWQQEGIDVSLVLRDAKRRPGLYWVQRDAHGERSFTYWRGESAARFIVQHAQFDRLASALAAADVLYLSGISLAILPDADRTRLLELLAELRAGAVTLIFDSNYRPSLWSTPGAAQAAVGRVCSMADLLLVTFEDERELWGDIDPAATLQRLRGGGARSITIKLGAKGCLHTSDEQTISVPAVPVVSVVDTTAAGDAFNAAYIAAWLAGAGPEACCRAANVLAARVIQHTGAIIARELTPTLQALLDAR